MADRPEGAGAFSQPTGQALENSAGAAQRRYRVSQLQLIAPHCVGNHDRR